MSRSPGRPAGFVLTVLLAVLAAAVALVASAAPASAHNVLESTNPKDGSTVSRVPVEVVLTFDDPAIAMGTQVIVRGPDGDQSAGPARLVDDTVRQTVGAGAPAGKYTVEWRVTSEDGHPVSGSFAFTATASGGSATPVTASPAPAPSRSSGGAGTALLVIVAVVVLGALGTGLVLFRRRRR